jgi:hypothetical protein
MDSRVLLAIILSAVMWSASTHIEADTVPQVSPLTYAWVLEGIRFVLLTAILAACMHCSPIKRYFEQNDIKPTTWSLGKHGCVALLDGVILTLATVCFMLAIGWSGKATFITGLTSPILFVMVALVGWLRGTFIPTWLSGTGIFLGIVAVTLLSVGNGVDASKNVV